MKLEFEEPSLRIFDTFSKYFEYLMNQNSLITVDTQRSRGNTADAGTGD